MTVRSNGWGKLMIKKYQQLWLYAKDYARKCRLVYKRMYSI
ncbi:hypothetical protein [Flagellimonas oceani]|nr:hypothetical protein [Allomuricauda oceani]